MRLKCAKLLTLLFCGLAFLFSSPFAQAASICDITCKGDDAASCEEIKKANGCGGATETIDTTIIGILDAVILISGLVAVVFVVVGGIQYTTSLGDASKVKKAKDTILYALIGVIVCALAYAIVNWVIVGVLKNASGDSSEGTPSSLIKTTLISDEASHRHII